MRGASRLIFTCLLGAAVAGCGGRAPSASRPATSAPVSRTVTPQALLTLDQIRPCPVLPATRPTTRPGGRTPVEALVLYAQARTALMDRQRFTAIAALQKALTLDPDSFDLHYALGRAFLDPASAGDQAIAELETAASLRPDHLQLQVLLGRQYLLKGDVPHALYRLRLAMQTSDYRSDEDSAGLADFFLARALQQAGYDRAALDRYELLVERLGHAGMGLRGNPELLYLANRPETLYQPIGQLYERLGDAARALNAYTRVAERDPDNFEIQSRIVHALLSLGRRDQAKGLAAECVTRFRASADSLDLLRDVYRQIGRADAVSEELAALHARRPDDRAILFALADVLRSQGRQTEAEKLLARAVDSGNVESDVVRRLFRFYTDRGAVEDAARLLIESIARRPALLRELAPLWSDLLRPTQKNRLRLADLQRLMVRPQAMAVKHFWVSRIADMWNRDVLARTALEQAVKLDPPLAPAYRLLLGQYWARPDWDEAQKARASLALAGQASQRGDAALAAELRGLTLLNQKELEQANDAFAQAMKLGGWSPDLHFTYANTLLALRKEVRAEQMLWKIIADFPGYEDAYVSLFRYYLQRRSMDQAVKVLTTWLSADPGNVNARILEASVYIQLKRPDNAEQILLAVFKNNSDNPDVLASLQSLYAQTGRVERYVALLEEERLRHPDNRDAITSLVRLYAARNRMAEASRVLDAMRNAVARDADLLYYVAQLYTRVDQKQTTEEVLRQVIRLEPTHAGANNDLGYGWADEGRNLDQAESCIRTALKSEPDNQSFLDSLGWVLYKRGRFEEARRYLEQALGTAARPDPVVLDHLGDVLYKLGRRADADKQWQRSMDRLDDQDDDRDDLKQLRLRLVQKLKSGERRQPVQVAPVLEPATRPVQARK